MKEKIEKIKNSFLNFYNTKRNLFWKIVGGVISFFVLLIVLIVVFRVPSPPEELQLSVRSYDSIRLTWIDPDRGYSYNIYRSRERETAFEKIATTQARHYIDEGLAPETTYYYRITKTKGNKESGYSVEVNATTENIGGVRNIRAEDIGYNYILLYWDGFRESEGYKIYRTESRDRPYVEITSTTNNYYADSGLEPSTAYYYEIRQKIGGELTEGTRAEFHTREWLCGSDILHDNKHYNTVKIGNQCWFSENLNYETDEGSWCYHDNEENCRRYGRLYSLDTALMRSREEKAQGICPNGWHVPSDDDFKTMERELGMARIDANDSGWRGNNVRIGDMLKLFGDCTDRSSDFCGTAGFDAILEGRRSPAGAYQYSGTHGFLWTSTFYNNNAWRRMFSRDEEGVHRDLTSPQNAFFVRCVKDI